MLHFFRHSILGKILVAYCLVSLIGQIWWPMSTWALTSGPTQPEVQGFQAANATDLVNPATGDFSYNIPLMDVEGYPLNISYSTGVNMESEAGMVGLGWKLNIGEVTRQMRGLPDDFKGDLVKKQFNVRPNITVGVKVKPSLELSGFPLEKISDKLKKLFKKSKDALNLELGAEIGPVLGLQYNNYRGFGFEYGVAVPSLGIYSGKLGSSNMVASLGASAGLNYSSLDGLTFNKSANFNLHQQVGVNEDGSRMLKHTIGIGLSSAYNSQAGLMQQNWGVTIPLPALPTLRINHTIYRATPSYTPSLRLPFHTLNGTFRLKAGAAVSLLHPNGAVEGYIGIQRLQYQEEQVPAYGLLHLHESKNSRDLTDFNRENDRTYLKHSTPNLAMAHHTYDVFNVAGHGVGGSYRVHRNDIGVIQSPKQGNYSDNFSLGLDFGLSPGGSHVGVNFEMVDLNSSTKAWTERNALSHSLDYASRNKVTSSEKTYFEPAFFKAEGEMLRQVESDYYTALGNQELVSPTFERNSQTAVPNYLTKPSGNLTSLGSLKYRSTRSIRKQLFDHQTASEADERGLVKNVRSYQLNTPPFAGETDMPSEEWTRSSNQASHAISEVSILREDGARYVYGIPAINHSKREVSFNASGHQIISDKGLIKYGDVDDSTANERGTDHYFDAVTTPAYAHSFLLSSVLAPDYVDLTEDGPTDDDLGTWHHIKYHRHQADYRWRFPIGVDESGNQVANLASHVPAFKVRPFDDQGSYVYGQRENWYPAYLESRNYIAVFEYSDRNDGLGVVDRKGVVDPTQTLKKLDKITLYAKSEWKSQGSNARKLQEVLFFYDYSLCPGVYNSTQYGQTQDNGKLTLIRVEMRSEDSGRARFNPYKFAYADPDHDFQINSDYNPPYHPKATDRWGYYKPNQSTLPNWEFPYVDQSPDASSPSWLPSDKQADWRLADNYAQAYLLSTIQLPSGGLIKVDYEADDYAYVQDAAAAQMIKILGLGDSKDKPVSQLSHDLFQIPAGGNAKDAINNAFVFFDLPQSVSSDQAFRNQYLPDSTKPVYFNLDIDMDGTGKYERVPIYLNAKSAGVHPSDPSVGYIEVGIVDLNEGEGKALKATELLYSALNFMRMQLPEIAFPGSAPAQVDTSQIAALLLGISGFFEQNRSTIVGPYRVMMDKGRCQGIRPDPGTSWARLQTPDGFKQGGGSRVWRVQMDDNLNSMTGESSQSYGQVYDYTTRVKGADGVTRSISSGVAAYEPILGGDENALKQIVEFQVDRRKRFPDDAYYIETPFCEFAFPAPQVVYSQVTIKSLPRDGVVRRATGATVQEFYTAKDYPTITQHTDLEPFAQGPDEKGFNLLNQFRDYVTLTQGYLAIINNMHGVMKSTKVFAEGASYPISGTEYYYRSQPEAIEIKLPGGMHNQLITRRLKNQALPVVYPDNSLGTETFGQDIEMVLDSRESTSLTQGLGIDANIDLSVAPPAVSGLPLPNFSYEHKRFRSLVATKVVSEMGILDSIVVIDNQARITTKHLAYDSETGEPLLSRVTNEYRDPLYSFTYPAHWAYEGMGQAYRNQRVLLDASSQGGNFSLGNIPQADQLFVPGDELWIRQPNQAAQRVWVAEVGSSSIKVLDRQGQLVDGSVVESIEVIRSGRRNQASGSLGTVSSTQNPLANGNSLDFQGILNANANIFAERWQTLCQDEIYATECLCEDPTSEALSLPQLMTDLQQSGFLFQNSPIDVLNHFPSFTQSALAQHLGFDPNEDWFWETTRTTSGSNCTGANIKLIKTLSDCSTETVCSFSLQFNVSCDLLDSLDYFGAIHSPPSAGCSNSNDLVLEGVIQGFGAGGSDSVINITGNIPCIEVRDCGVDSTAVVECYQIGDTLNPYVAGIRGIWMPKQAYTYLTGRENSSFTPGVATDIRRDGTFSQFQPFWQYQSGWTTQPSNWTWAARATKHLPYSLEIESEDALNRFSSAQYGYNFQVPVATAANARYEEMGSTGFELASDFTRRCGQQVFFTYLGVSGQESAVQLSPQAAHSGYQSALLSLSHQSLKLSTSIGDGNDPVDAPDQLPFTLDESDCLLGLKPDTGRYVVGFWVKGDHYDYSLDPLYDYPDIGLVATVDGNALTPELVRRSPLIEGWQRLEYVIAIPTGQSLSLEIKRLAGNDRYYVDDFRFHPYLSQMETYVYDPSNLRLLAKLDPNNYGTFYQYDHAGALTSIKRETRNGIQTLKEVRSGQAKLLP